MIQQEGNLYRKIWDVVINQTPAKKYPPGFDCLNFVYYLWLKRPNESVKKGYMCYLSFPIFGNQWEHYKDSPEETGDLIFKMFNEKFNELCAVAFPYIEDGCVEISNNHKGPWVNLTPGG